MGHHGVDKSSLIPLIDRLNQYPVGLVDNERLRQILSLLFSEEEAFVASRFPLQEATLAELVKRTRYAGGDLQAILERMADKGLVMDVSYGDKVYYLLLPGLIGFFELTFMKQRTDLPLAELARLMHEYLYDDPLHGQAREFFGSTTPLTRSLPYEEQVPVNSEVTSYASAREIIRQAGFGAVGMCYCRHKKEHLGETCQKGAPTAGTCISLGAAARFMVRRGFAEQRSEAELLAVLEQARQLNLTHITDNIRQKPSFICNCCVCCCELMAGVQHGYHAGVAKSGYRVTVAADLCAGCGICVDACNVKALRLIDGAERGRWSLDVKEEGCLGCGACVPVCPVGALRLEIAETGDIPETRRRLMLQILQEKGRLKPYLVSGAKNKVRSLLRIKR